jgi:signal transduction histidine kinase
VLIVNESGELQFDRNVDEKLIDTPQKVDSLVAEMGRQYPPIMINFAGIRQRAFYKDSRIITDLEHTLDDLINSFISETVMNSGAVPVIFTDSTQTEVLLSANVDTTFFTDSLLLQSKLKNLAAAIDPIEVRFGNHVTNYIFYTESIIVTTLRYYPYVQLLTIGLFLFISYLIFSTFRRAEQNQVWIGMAKETAHQLGTPLSSLMAWVQLLEARGTDKETITELNKDVNRLETITDRFSKIGSKPDLQEVEVADLMQRAVDYLKLRVSRKVEFYINVQNEAEIKALVNEALFGWVIENLFKNAVDAMEGSGTITIDISHEIQNVYIDVTDTGKGIPSAKHKAIFQPGFTTKKRGWGLGLSLAKRIIETYHSGKIFVKRSEPDKGTTFRIVLKTKA